MKKNLSIIVITLCLSLNIAAQEPFGNEWINFNQTYFKISTAQDGIYRISYEELQAAGLPVDAINPRRFQIFHRGVEQAINVAGELNARFEPGEFIEFYGQQNDGRPDARQYVSPDAQLHQYYNLYTDTTAYFLTWRLDTGNGLRMSTFSENNVTNIPLEPFAIQDTLMLFTDTFAAGQRYPRGSGTASQHVAAYDSGEGWFDSRVIRDGQNITTTIADLIPISTSAFSPTLEVTLAGTFNSAKSINLEVGPSTSQLRIVADDVLTNEGNLVFNEVLQSTDIADNGVFVVRVTQTGSDPTSNRSFVRIGSIKLTYPSTFEFGQIAQREFGLRENVSGRSFFELQNTPASFSLFDITDEDRPRQIGFNRVGPDITAVIDGTNIQRRVLAVSGARLSAPVRAVSFQPINPQDYNYLIVTHPFLRQSAGNFSDPVAAYRDYRGSAAGGNYSPLIVEVQQLYDQFNFGEISPLGIHDFVRFMMANGDPQFLFLIGKGFTFVEQNPLYRGTPNPNFIDLVPASGFPGADGLFSAGLNNRETEELLPTGRLNARTAQQVANYLEKVIDQESQDFDNLRRKTILHLSGGRTLSELTQFRQFVTFFEETAESSVFGGNTITDGKTSRANVEFLDVADIVNEGISLMTFFGHSSPSFADINVGFVTDPNLNFNNTGRYPILLVNGCNAGDIFTTNITFGEDWVLAEDIGALGFVSHVATGFASELRRYSDIFYDVATADSAFVNQSIGVVKQEVGRRYFQEIPSFNEQRLAQVQQIILQGDPAVRLFGAERPDYNISAPSVSFESFDGGPITALTDSFAVNIITENFGRVQFDSLTVTLQRILPSSIRLPVQTLRVPAISFADTVTFIVRTGEEDVFGNNQFDIRVDALNEVEELNETNNLVNVDLFLPRQGTTNLVPKDFGIVNSTSLELVVQSSDLLIDEEQDYIIEVDTSPLFSNPIARETIRGRALVTASVTLPNQDSTIYYWRSRLASGTNDDFTGSSFTYINNSTEGWRQSSVSQIGENALSQIEQNGLGLVFQTISAQIEIGTGGSSVGEQDLTLRVNGSLAFESTNGCGQDALYIGAIDRESGEPYVPVPEFGGPDDLRLECGGARTLIDFINVVTDLGRLPEVLSQIDNGDFVYVFSFGTVDYQQNRSLLLSELAPFGIDPVNINALANGDPYIMIGQLGGESGSATEILATTPPFDQQVISTNTSVDLPFANGSILTPLIGPASDWQSLVLNVTNIDTPDEFSVDIIGLDTANNQSVLASNITDPNFDIPFSADIYPNLRLQINFNDEVNFTPATLSAWQVNFAGVPEGILLPATGQRLVGIPLNEGQEQASNFTFQNISSVDFTDSLSIEYTISNGESRTSETNQIRIAPPVVGSTSDFAVPITTIERLGPNDLRIEANVNGEVREQNLNNNILDIANHFDVTGDRGNPLIEVAFDGDFILDGDIVSPSPLISIRVKDDNDFRFIQDTTTVDVLLREPCETCVFERVSYSRSDLRWFPADEENDFSIEFNPQNLEDGVYTISVQARDVSGNAAGTEPFRVNFEVISESSITHFFPYPNPFSTSTRFVFTLTGAEIPDQVKIQIMTVTGRIVREINQDELGPIRIGNNVSEFAWDGRDEFGGQLANGVLFVQSTGI